MIDPKLQRPETDPAESLILLRMIEARMVEEGLPYLENNPTETIHQASSIQSIFDSTTTHRAIYSY